MFDAESKEIDLIFAVPIFVLDIVPVDPTLIVVFDTQCKSTVSKLLIGSVPNKVFAKTK